MRNEKKGENPSDGKYYGNSNVGPGGLFACDGRSARMRDALSALERAKSELEQASHDKGGHRENAIKRINEAISEVQKGIEYDRTHVSPEERGKVNLNDLKDMRAQNLDSEMKNRGFRHKGGYNRDQSSFTTWWNSSTTQCVSIETKNGRVRNIEEIFEGNCK